MFRIAVGLSLLGCLASAAPTVHLLPSSYEWKEDNRELPLTIKPETVTMKPLVEAIYVNPVNYNQPKGNAYYQPAQHKSFYYYPLTYLHAYYLPSFHRQPLIGYQWSYSNWGLPQRPTIQTPNTNGELCLQPYDVGFHK